MHIASVTFPLICCTNNAQQQTQVQGVVIIQTGRLHTQSDVVHLCKNTHHTQLQGLLRSPVNNVVAVDVYQGLQQGMQHLASYEALSQALPVRIAATPTFHRSAVSKATCRQSMPTWGVPTGLTKG